MHDPAASTVRWALHRHDTPDGRWHLDWMLGPWPGLTDAPSPDTPALRSWRVMADPRDALHFDAEDAPNHRLAYLDLLAHDLGGGRGRTVRLATGHARLIPPLEPNRCTLTLLGGPEPPGDRGPSVDIRLLGHHQPARPGWWSFRRID